MTNILSKFQVSGDISLKYELSTTNDYVEVKLDNDYNYVSVALDKLAQKMIIRFNTDVQTFEYYYALTSAPILDILKKIIVKISFKGNKVTVFVDSPYVEENISFTLGLFYLNPYDFIPVSLRGAVKLFCQGSTFHVKHF